MNSVMEVAKARRLAKQLNNPTGHAKDAEKGRRVKKPRTVAVDFETEYDAPNTLTGVYSAEDLRDLGVRS